MKKKQKIETVKFRLLEELVKFEKGLQKLIKKHIEKLDKILKENDDKNTK